MKRDADWGLNDLYCSGPLDETNWPLTSNRGTQEATLPTHPSEVAKSHQFFDRIFGKPCQGKFRRFLGKEGDYKND